ncbi:MAG: RNA pseudouridine synthase [Bacteroidales bacterium]|nr:RNA pseudouridine synthase [Bacteroidales bacterium]
MEIIYEDNHILAVNKTCHEIVQADKTGDEPLSETLKRLIKERDSKPGNVFLGVTHRLDRPTTGVVLFAKTSKALERLNRMFSSGEVHKTYWCIVENVWAADKSRLEESLPPKEQDLTDYLVRNEKQNRSYAYNEPHEGAKEARLHYRVMATTERYALLEVQLYTGRHHQIRCQLANIGLPIKGDLKYGAPRSNPDGGISLHSRRVQFIHPVSKQEVVILAPVPDDNLWKALANQLA